MPCYGGGHRSRRNVVLAQSQGLHHPVSFKEHAAQKGGINAALITNRRLVGRIAGSARVDAYGGNGAPIGPQGRIEEITPQGAAKVVYVAGNDQTARRR